ncbi:hypothetical protein RSOLAG1IB_11488 [Rhizoctonia solani AG-1 IB]|nr:hypothetical protein RSOLAG1IB_11488 [Rhizoctonia solani AG-1 IB]
MKAREMFTDYVAHYVGPALCTKTDCPAPVVIGDPRHKNWPILPSPPATLQQEQRNLHEYFTALLRWQGGVSAVPYAMIEQSMTANNYEMVSLKSLPEGEHVLRSPFMMTAEETRQWTLHIRGQEDEEITRFRFELLYPNRPIGNSTVQRAAATVLSYGPDALAYARQVYSYSDEPRAPRGDGLPNFSAAEPAYHSLVDREHAALMTGVQESPDCVKMLQCLREFDEAFPIHADVGVWHVRSSQISHLKSEVPPPNASIDHLLADGGWLPPELYDIAHPDHFVKGLARTFAWCHPRTISHGRTGTLMGGPMGVKWPVLILCHIQFNALALKTNWQEAVAYYGDLALNGKVAFLERDLEELRGAIEALTNALIESTALLRSTMDQRRVLTASEHVDALTRQAHAHFPTSSDGYTLHVTVDDCEAWDNAVMGLENQETVPDEQSEESFEGKMSKSRPDTAKGKKADKVQSSATRSTTVS